MKREILFRAKSIEPSTEGKWIIGSLVVHGNCNYILPNNPITPFGIVKYRVNPETVGEFTGLKSKKKKTNISENIFEGDMFRGLNDNDIEVYYVVMWIEQRAAFYMIPADHYCVIRDNNLSNDKDFNWLFDDAMLYDFSSDCGLTKVGNIYDNKDLLK